MSVMLPIMNDALRPIVSATTPVGTSKIDLADRERRVHEHHLEDVEPRLHEEERIDAPDERCGERKEARWS